MVSYLSWLQEEGEKSPAPAPTAPVIDLPPAPPRPTNEAGVTRPKHKLHSKPAPAPTRPPSGAAIPVIDVELAPASAPQPVFGLPLTRRDFVVFGLGAGAGALATFLGCLVAVFSRRPPPPAAPPVEEKKEN